MGFFYFTSCYTIWFVIISLSFSSIFQACYAYDPKSLENFLYDYTYRSLEIMPQLGTLYNIDLPSNFTGMKISFIRLSIETFWKGGANFTSFYIPPPKAITEPNVKIIAIVYENLGNWSSFYLKVPNYTFVAPIIGFMAYESPNYFKLGNRKLIFNLEEKPISIRFSELINGTNLTPKCIQFDDIGRYEIKNMTEANVCFASGQAQYFSLVVPSTGTSLLPKKKNRYWKSWVIGIFGGIFGLIFFGSVIMVIMKKYKLRSMEKQSEKDLSFDTFWVGRSKMPSASMVRTQPSLEHEDVP